MVYERSLAQQTHKSASQLLELLLNALPFQDGETSRLIVEGISEARNLRDLAARRIDISAEQKRRRDGSAAALLPAPRSNHEGA